MLYLFFNGILHFKFYFAILIWMIFLGIYSRESFLSRSVVFHVSIHTKNWQVNNFCMNGNILKGSYLTKPCERFFNSDFNILAAPSLWILPPPPFQVSKHIYLLIVSSIDHYWVSCFKVESLITFCFIDFYS